MTTPVLAIEEVASGQVNQYLIYNAALRALEASQNDVLTVNLASENVTVASSQFTRSFMFVASGHSVTRTLTFPAQKRQFTVRNAGTAAVSVTVGATSVSVTAGEVFFFYCDGTANSLVAIGGGGGGAPEWGDIGGDIADQSDLASALGTKANTADLGTVATSNDYADLDNIPTLGTAAATDADDYATAAQGTLADTAVQLGDLASVATSGAADDVFIDDAGSYYSSTDVEGALQEIGSVFIPDTLRKSVEASSGGRMTVLYTASGQPSYMHVFPAFNCEDVAPNGELGTGLHPAFLFDGVAASEIFVGAYQASTSQSGGAAVSLPMVDPHININFDAARNLCKANGPGWDIMSNLDWAAIALWCMANGYEPRGNTDYGRSHESRWETGRRVGGVPVGQPTNPARTLTGSGRASWAHDGTPAGIHDLVGNVWEWVGGVKMVDGRVWLALDNGLTEEAQYIDSGFDMPSNRVWSTVDSAGASDLIKQSLIAPASPALSPVGQLLTNLAGERLPNRGGTWSIAGHAGLAALNLDGGRTGSFAFRGFRPRFRNP